MIWILNIIGVFVLSVLFAGIMIPQILLISFRKKLFDVTDVRKIHTCAVPRLGGIAFMPVIFISIALVLGFNLYIDQNQLAEHLLGSMQCIAFCFSALFVLYIVGMADDLIGVRYRAKFVVQVFCAILLILGGLSINDFYGFLTLNIVPDFIAYVFTIYLVVFIINAINLIDGIDGLASGLSSVAVIVYGVFFYLSGNYICAMISAGTLGVLVPFFFFNVFGNPNKHKKIFMGDTGTLTIGLFLCILSFKLLQTEIQDEFTSVNHLIVAMSPLVIPCFDVIRVYFYRIRHHANPFLPDKNHIHHKLLALGMNQRVAMMTIVGSSMMFTVINITLSQWLNVNFIILIDITIWTICTSIIPMYIKKHLKNRLKRC